MSLTRNHCLVIGLLVLAAVVVRLIAFSPYAIHHPDEQIQYLEQAHRLLFGSGVVPWEYRYGMRSWLVPLLLAGPMWLGERLAPGTILYVVLPRLTFAVIALAPLWAAWSIGSRISRRHGLMALGVLALWYESVYFSVHVLTETLSVALFLPAAALLLGERTRNQLLAAGALLGFAVIFRFHYGPAAAVLVAMTLRTRWREWGWLIVGALLPELVSSAVDLAMGQWPFAWMVANIRYNVIENKAAQFGEFGAEAYAQMLWLGWTFAIAPILWLAYKGARRFPVLAVAAVVNVLVHLAIGHKEYRFILLSTQLAILLAAIGTVDLVAGWRRGADEDAAPRDRLLASAFAAWVLVSALLTVGGLSDPGWRRFGSGYELSRMAAQRRVCGVAIFAGTTWPPVGQLWLHDATPQYDFYGPTRVAEARWVARTAHAYTAIIADPGRPSIPADYRPVACRGAKSDRLCLLIRPGGCTRDALSDSRLMQTMMEKNDR